MIAWIIKNKANKYYHDTWNKKDWWQDDIIFAQKFRDKTEARYFLEQNKDIKGNPVMISIVEGNIENKNNILKKALELACELFYERDGEEGFYTDETLTRFINHTDYPNYFKEMAKKELEEGEDEE